MEICRDRDRRSPSAKSTARSQYGRLLERVIRRQSPDWRLAKLSTTMDLERSFSPVYARGLLRQGRSSFAVLGVNHQETQGAIDAALSFALLWLDSCREREAGSSLVEGLRIFVPRGRATTLQIRMAHLNHAKAKFRLFELDERDESLNEIDTADTGNIETRLLQSPNAAQTRERFGAAISKVLGSVSNSEVAVLGSRGDWFSPPRPGVRQGAHGERSRKLSDCGRVRIRRGRISISSHRGNPGRL